MNYRQLRMHVSDLLKTGVILNCTTNSRKAQMLEALDIHYGVDLIWVEAINEWLTKDEYTAYQEGYNNDTDSNSIPSDDNHTQPISTPIACGSGGANPRCTSRGVVPRWNNRNRLYRVASIACTICYIAATFIG